MPVLPALPVTAITIVSVRARAGRAAEIVQSFQRVADADQPLLVARRKGPVDDGAGGALIERRGDERMSVAVRPADGDEALALAEAAGVDGEAGNRRLGRAKTRAARGGRISPRVQSGSATFRLLLQRGCHRVMVGKRNDGSRR